MYLSKGEYSQFSLRGRINLIQQFGMPVYEKILDEVVIKIYHLYDFYVEVILEKNKIIKAEPVLYSGLLEYYL
jgi:hypothetical protein